MRHRGLNHQSPHTGSKDFVIEIQEQPNRKPQDSHVGKQLGLVQADESLDALDLDDHTAIHDEVWSIFANQVALVQNWNRNLPDVADASCREVETKRLGTLAPPVLARALDGPRYRSR